MSIHEDLMDTSDKARAARREGGSLRARFFRWKDEVFPLAVRSEVTAWYGRRYRGGLIVHRPGVGDEDLLQSDERMRKAFAAHSGAQRALCLAPEDPAAYREACRSFKDVLEALTGHGLRPPPWKDPPGE